VSETKGLSRPTDPETSREAAAAVLPRLRTSQQEVLTLFRRVGPMTHAQLVDAARRYDVPQSPSSLRTRTSELVKAGVLADSGVRETVGVSPGGIKRRAVVWCLPADVEVARKAQQLKLDVE